MSWQLVTDIARSIAIGEVFISIGYMIRLLYDSNAYLKDRHFRYANWRWHALSLGVPYCLLLAGVGIELQEKVGEPATFRTPIFVVAATSALVGQVWTRKLMDGSPPTEGQ